MLSLELSCQALECSRVLFALLHLMSGRFSRQYPCRFNFVAKVESEIGTHDKPVRCVEWLGDRGLLATGSWDGTLRLWDPRLRPVSGRFHRLHDRRLQLQGCLQVWLAVRRPEPSVCSHQATNWGFLAGVWLCCLHLCPWS